ncbi:MAG: arginine--tRNA ligase, partial [Prevotella sp.]|nr:arginine--tRNA ligase [Prevotella sp.]
MNIEERIQQAAIDAVKTLYGMEPEKKMVQLQKTRAEFEGNLTLVVFPFVKIARKSPEQVGEEIGKELVEHSGIVSAYNVVKGFLNLSVSGSAWRELLADIDADDHYGEKKATEDSDLVM